MKRIFYPTLLFYIGFLFLFSSCQTVFKQTLKQTLKQKESETKTSPMAPSLLSAQTGNQNTEFGPKTIASLPPSRGTIWTFPPEPPPMGDFTTRPGWVSVFQTFTSDKETSINILRPRLTRLAYYVEADQGPPVVWQSGNRQKVIKTTSGPLIHWKVDRIHIKNLKPQQSYRLVIVNRKIKKALDWRRFKSLDLNKKQVRFLVGSCLSDSHAFEHIRGKIWDQMLTHGADFLMLLGDQVYVDDFDFVPRKKPKSLIYGLAILTVFARSPFFRTETSYPYWLSGMTMITAVTMQIKTFLPKKHL